MQKPDEKSSINSSYIPILIDFKPTFPPKITNDDLVSKSNAFIIYRRVFNREISELKHNISLEEISGKVSESWNKEPELFKNFYRKLANPSIINGSNDPRSGNFNIILQHANNGNLRDYLQSKQSEEGFKIPWTDLIQIAKGITLGLKCLHENKFIHLDLNYDYSSISIKIFLYEREEMTPQGYADLYMNCWSSYPENRPKLDSILCDLERLSTETAVKFIINVSNKST
ncbi:20214_t:CDS:2, partial [Dentiscutata erythropus]